MYIYLAQAYYAEKHANVLKEKKLVSGDTEYRNISNIQNDSPCQGATDQVCRAFFTQINVLYTNGNKQLKMITLLKQAKTEHLYKDEKCQ